MKCKKDKSSSDPQKKSWTSQPAPKKAVHNTGFTPATDQPMDIDSNNAESQPDETDKMRLMCMRSYTLCMIVNNLWVLYIVPNAFNADYHFLAETET